MIQTLTDRSPLIFEFFQLDKCQHGNKNRLLWDTYIFVVDLANSVFCLSDLCISSISHHFWYISEIRSVSSFVSFEPPLCGAPIFVYKIYLVCVTVKSSPFIQTCRVIPLSRLISETVTELPDSLSFLFLLNAIKYF